MIGPTFTNAAANTLTVDLMQLDAPAGATIMDPLTTLVQPPQRTNDFVNSLLASRRESPYGVLPVWPFHGLATRGLIGYPEAPVIADAYMKALRG